MALIDCPQCGKKVLSLASTCPNCGYPVGQQRAQEARQAALVTCRQCGRGVHPRARACPYCGIDHPRRQRAYWLIPAVAVLVLAAVAAFELSRRMSREPDETPSPAVAEVEAEVDSQPAAPALALERDTVVATPDSQVPEPAATVQAPPTPTPPTQTRWTSTWVNVREGRGPATPIAQILNPGEPIEVGAYERGWWAVYVEGRVIGYVANSLIRREPPDSTPGPRRFRFYLP